MRTRDILAVALGAAALLASRTATAGACVPGFDFAMFAKDGVHIQGNAGTDSYDSSAGSYGATRTCADAAIGTNATRGGAVHLQGAVEICGDAAIGAGGNPASAITGNGDVLGARRAQAANVVLPEVTIPALPSAATFNPTSQNAHATLAPNQRYGTVTCKNGSLTLSAGTYVVASIVLAANCELTLGTGRVEIYFTNSLHLQGGVVANASQVPGNLVFYGGPAASSVHLQGGVDASFAVYAPRAACHLQGNADVWGALVCAEGHIQGNAHVHYDRALANLEGGGFECPAVEVSRATPVVATLDGEPTIVQGTYELPRAAPAVIATAADVAKFTFPGTVGHVRARTAASITTTATSFADGTVRFDAAAPGNLPTPRFSGCATIDGSCRHVFTTTVAPGPDGTAARPPMVVLGDGTASTIGALIAPASAVPGITPAHWQALVRRVLAGRPDGAGGYRPVLGGVDRSTVAVIPPSTAAGVATRPTIAYVGARDGMLHAICATAGGSTPAQANICPRAGTELWAFLPRVQLPLLRRNAARIDGSPRVVDAFGDFDGTGVRSFRTVLTFQTGTSDAPAVYALDVTDPAAPTVLWEYAPSAAPGAFELGAGLALAAGPTRVGGGIANLVVAQTRNGGTGGAGMVATALRLETGTRAWQFAAAYPSPPRGRTADLPLPATGIPGGAVAVDLTGAGFLTDLVMGDLYGRLWRLDAATGASRTGTAPLFELSTNKHPIGAVPAIYADGNRRIAAFGTGGYADPVAATWSAGTQSLIAIDLAAPGPYPLTETSPALALRVDLGPGEDAFAQVLVVGGELWVATDTTDVNAAGYGTGGATGRVLRYDLAAATATTVVVRGGASSLARAGDAVYGSSSDRQEQLVAPPGSAPGASVDTAALPRLWRRLWLRTE